MQILVSATIRGTLPAAAELLDGALHVGFSHADFPSPAGAIALERTPNVAPHRSGAAPPEELRSWWGLPAWPSVPGRWNRSGGSAGLLSACGRGGPAPRQRDHVRFVLGPVVQGGGIEIGTAWPDQRMDLAVKGNCVELVDVAQRTVKLPFQHRPKVDRANQAIVKLDPESVRPFDLERLHLVDRMSHAPTSYRRGSILPGGLPACSRSQAANSSG